MRKAALLLRDTLEAPVDWAEVERGIKIEDFRIDNIPARVERRGDLWAPLLAAKGRFRLERPPRRMLMGPTAT